MPAMSELEGMKQRLAEIKRELHSLKEIDLSAAERSQLVVLLVDEIMELHERRGELVIHSHRTNAAQYRFRSNNRSVDSILRSKRSSSRSTPRCRSFYDQAHPPRVLRSHRDRNNQPATYRLAARAVTGCLSAPKIVDMLRVFALSRSS